MKILNFTVCQILFYVSNRGDTYPFRESGNKIGLLDFFIQETSGIW